MAGWLYIIKNGDLYKIGITRKFENRMRQLKPDYIVAKLYSRDFKELEREFHKKYKNVRIPQSEYFRLDPIQVKEIKYIISRFYYPKNIIFDILLNSVFLLLIISLFLVLVFVLTINDIKSVISLTLLWMEKTSFSLSFLSLFIRSNKFFNFLNELKFRFSRFSILFLFGFFFRFASRLFFFNN